MKKLVDKRTKFKLYLLIVLVSLLFLSGLQNHPALAYSVNLTIEAIEDAGSASLQNAFARFVKEDDRQFTLHVVDPNSVSQWSSKDDVVNYAASHNHWDHAWVLESAGNIWSQSDHIVGETLVGLSAGIYRISVAGGAFTYDRFGWSPYYGKYYWQLQIRGFLEDDTPVGPPQMLGSIGDYLNPDDAYYDNLGKYLDIHLPGNGHLVFWILDWNSLDNWGTLEVNVTLVPVPGTFLLLGTGLVFFAVRMRLQK